MGLGGVKFHRNEKFQKTKVIYFMFGTSSFMGRSKIRILHFIRPPNLRMIKILSSSAKLICMLTHFFNFRFHFMLKLKWKINWRKNYYKYRVILATHSQWPRLLIMWEKNYWMTDTIKDCLISILLQEQLIKSDTLCRWVK